MSHFRVKVRSGDVEVEVDSSDKEYTEAKVKELLAAFGPGKTPRAAAAAPEPKAKRAEPAPAPAGSAKRVSMVEYVRSLGPKGGTQYVIAVGQYLEQHGGMAGGFKTRDIVDGFQTVKFKHANPREAVRQAKAQGFVMDAKEPGAMVVTQTGEAWIKAQLTEMEDAA
jgi:hypothetical protein